MSLLSNKQQDGGAGGKLDRKELKKPDQFTTSMTEFFSEISKHKQAMFGIVAVIAVIGIGAAWFANQKHEKAEAGKSALFLANQAVEKKVETMVAALTPKEEPTKDAKKGATQKAPPKPTENPENVLFKKLDVDQEFSEGVKLYRDLFAKFGSSAPAVEGRMELARLYYRHGQPEKAIPLYQEAVEMASGTSEKAYALSGLGYSLENAGKPKEALAAFENGVNQGEANLKGDLLLAVARNHEALKDPAKAKATYDQIISQLPNTEFSKTAQVLKAKL